MDTLKQLTQTIVVIVILAVFLEMLLPRGDMRRYVKMVMGLLIIVAVLQAAAGAINSDLLRDIPDITRSTEEFEPVPLEDIMAAGQTLSQANREEAARHYSEGISRQVMSLAGLNQDLCVTDARVKLKDNSGEISAITITCTAPGGGDIRTHTGEGSVSMVEPVVVGNSETAANEEDQSRQPTENEMKAASRMATVVANFYNLRPEQVEIQFQ